MALLIVAAGSIVVFAIAGLVRNEWVFKQRMELNRFEDGEHVIRRYISYNDMMLRFWVWDVEKLKKQRICK